MIGLGFQEVINFTLTSKEKHFIKMEERAVNFVEIKNPVSGEYCICRTCLTPSLMENLMYNKHRKYPQRIFEVGDAVIIDEKAETRSRNSKRLCVVSSHAVAGLSEAVSLVNSIASNLGLNVKLKNQNSPFFIKGRAGVVVTGKSKKTVKQIGVFGEVSPKVLENFELNTPVIVLELDLDEIFSARN